jgi:signal peptidase I
MSDSQSDDRMEESREEIVDQPVEEVSSDSDPSAFSKNGEPEQLSFLDEPDVFTPGDFPDEPVEPEMMPYDAASEASYGQTPDSASEASFVQDTMTAPAESREPAYAQPEETAAETEEPAEQPGMVIRRVRTESSDIGAKPKERGFLYTLLDTTRFISLGLVIGILLVVFVVQRNDVYGYSMQPTLNDGDAVFVEMISKYTNSYKRGEIVTVNATGMEGYSKQEKLIKRIIGRPGDTISIKDGLVYLNGALLDEPYLAEGTKTFVSADGTAKGYDNVVLGPDQYYIMGDNRGASLDSRVIGPVSVDRIKAHVILRIYPFDQIDLF